MMVHPLHISKAGWGARVASYVSLNKGQGIHSYSPMPLEFYRSVISTAHESMHTAKEHAPYAEVMEGVAAR